MVTLEFTMSRLPFVSALLAALLVASFSPGAPAPTPTEYEFVPDTRPWFRLSRGGRTDIGKLDEAGNFIPDPHWCNVPGIASGEPYNQLLNGPPGPAYEYRSGRLIPGELDQKGYFIPEIGGKIITLEDYRPGPKATRIYNLPGKFMKKEQKDGK
jgi:hypothetical protein